VAPSRSEVDQLRALVPRLDPGETETLVLLADPRLRAAKLLIDEGFAFGYVLTRILPRVPTLELVCLAQVLHQLEDAGHLPVAAAAAMQTLVDHDWYRWAPNVRQHYLQWCRQHGKPPLQ
jgi:hypothetical protein